MTLDQLTRTSIARLSQHYEESEARWLTRISLEHLTGLGSTDLLLHGDREASEATAETMDRITERLLEDEPIQYILGETYWHGLTLKVTPAVLIPRPETSQLVDIIADEAGQRADLTVVDLCTGSGCIAIALARRLPFAQVTAIDISADALEVARENAGSTRTSIRLVQADVLAHLPLEESSADIIVSNPPYVCESEKAAMSRNVLDYEPHTALFVPDSDALRFYRSISRQGRRIATPGGKLYLEINPLQAAPLLAMLEADGWDDPQTLKDIHGKNRFVRATNPTR